MKMNPYTEFELPMLLAKGDRRAYEIIYNQYFRPIRARGISALKSEEEADDLAHEVLRKVWENRKSFAQVTNLKAYISKMTSNGVKDRIGKKAQERKLVRGELDEHIDHESTPEDSILHAELESQVRKVIEQLPSRRRKVVKMKIEGHANEAIAESLDISINTVKAHAAQGRKFIRDEITKYLGGSCPLIYE